MHAILANDLRDEIELAGARTLLVAVSDCQASYVFAGAEQYRCDRTEGPSVDLIAEPSQLSSLPDACFDVVVGESQPVFDADVEAAVAELWRVLAPGGRLLLSVVGWHPSDPSGTPGCSAELLRFGAVDPVTRRPGFLYSGQKPGTVSEKRATGELSGYAYHLSRRSGRRIVFCLDGSSPSNDPVPIKALSNEIVGEIDVNPHSVRSNPSTESWREGFRLSPRAAFDLDPSLPGGVYLLDGKIPFVHHGPDSASIAVLIPSHTGVAFDQAGGRNLYKESGSPAADSVSFHRPLSPGLLMNGCWPFVKWFSEANPYRDDTAYLVDLDLEGPGALDAIEVLLVIGRSEYWTRTARERFDAFVDRGGRALLLCSEIMHWQVRVDLMRGQLICPKGCDEHPDPLLRANFWHDPSLKYPIYPRTGCELWYGGAGAVEKGIGWDGMRIVAPDSPLLIGSDLNAGDVVDLPDTTEWDGAPVRYTPDGTIQVDFGHSPPWRHEVVGYNLVKPAVDELPAGKPATSLWIVLRRTEQSGTVIHGGCMAWCGERAIGDTALERERNRRIVLNMLRLLRDDIWPFTDRAGMRPIQSVTAAST
jgi:SAM-dependent methyltransferase